MNLFNVFLVWLPDFSLYLLLRFLWCQLLLVQSYISYSTFVVSLHINSLYFSCFSAIFCATFLFCLCVSLDSITLKHLCFHTLGCVFVCVHTICLLFQCLGLYILSNTNVHQLNCISLLLLLMSIQDFDGEIWGKENRRLRCKWEENIKMDLQEVGWRVCELDWFGAG